MESAKLNVVHFNSEDVIATSGILKHGTYYGSFLMYGGKPELDKARYVFDYYAFDDDVFHDSGVEYEKDGFDFYPEKDTDKLFFDNEPFDVNKEIKNAWYDLYVSSDYSIRYFYSEQ